MFEALLTDSIFDGAECRTVNPEKYAVLSQVYEKLSELVGDSVKPRLKLRPEFASGGVSVKVPSAELNSEQLQKLKEILPDCSTFSVDPYVDGNLDVAVTVQKVFQNN